MKKLILIVGAMLLTLGVTPVAAVGVSTTDITNAIAEVNMAIDKVGAEANTLRDANGVMITNHVNYLRRQVLLAQMYLNGCLSDADVEEIYDALTEGAAALLYLTNKTEGMSTPVVTASVDAASATVAQNNSATFVPKVPMAGSVAK